MSIVFTGDFYQLKPVNLTTIYKDYHMLWYSLVRLVIKMKTNRRFDNDKVFSEILDRYRKKWTEVYIYKSSIQE